MTHHTVQNADNTVLSAFALPDAVREILARFDAAGAEAYCVGGCVRDALRGTPPHDWDLCTSALPEQTLALFSDKPTLTVGMKHGTVTVLWDGMPVEITTYRCEGAYVGHRTPSSVSFTPSLYEDCQRRDFTVNALAYHPQKGLMDYFGGAQDLKHGVLRCVGAAAERFDEDALRILRALRFSSVLDMEITSETAAALHTCAPYLADISGERICAEFLRFLTGVRAASLLSDYADVIGVCIPPLAACKQHREALTQAFIRCTTDRTRLAAALYLCGITDCGSVRTALSRLPCSRAFLDAVVNLIRDAALPPPQSRPDVRHSLSQSAAEPLYDRLCLHAALFPDDREACDRAAELCRSVIDEGDVTRLSALAVNGSDLAACGIRGRAIGQLLQSLLDAVMDDRTENTKDALLAYANAHLL